MAIDVRKSADRGYFKYAWLRTYHTFSFDGYEDPIYQGYRALRIINENYMRPGTGFPVQSHQDMEIFSIVINGKITHQDDLGNGSILSPGQIQLLSTGKGVTHSTYNASDKDEAHFLQVWMLPIDRKIKPSYQEKFFSPESYHNRLCLILSSNGREGSLHIHQKADIYLATLDQGKELNYQLESNRYGWIQVVKGEVEVNGILLEHGDGASIREISQLTIKAHTQCQIIFFDLD